MVKDDPNYENPNTIRPGDTWKSISNTAPNGSTITIGRVLRTNGVLIVAKKASGVEDALYFTPETFRTFLSTLAVFVDPVIEMKVKQ
jgi:ethanolamine utilization microcompartment shell protein EutS